MLTLALVGRPNVGKSTLFNRLAGKRLAIVNDRPGVTRDWREAEGHLFDRSFRILDTAGLEESFDESIQARMRQQTESALKQASAILFIVDGRAGITPMDKHFADFLRKQKIPVILAVNKCEHETAAVNGIAEAWKLSLGEPIVLSAEHGLGFEDLYHRIEPFFPEKEEETGHEKTEDEIDDNIDDIEGREDYEFADEEAIGEKPIKIAIVGRPNVGKSSLLNTIVGSHRSMTGPEAGITRDPVTMHWDYKGRAFRLVDTAGMRKQARIYDEIEKMSVDESLRAIRLAQVVILVLDATQLIEKQDLLIASHVLKEGRALIIAINKWDLVADRKKTIGEIEYRLRISLAQVPDIAYVPLSAKNNKNIDRLLDTVLEIFALWNKRAPTAGLNRWLRSMESRNPAPLVEGRANRLKYITQVKTRPPTFAVWVSRAAELPLTYQRFLINGLREDYELKKIPLKLLVRKSKNPFNDEG
ncbi:MAG: ribosome biogenesis GTPase Der [Alphaproteobacteria bacterium]